jgi:hypothetical protein
MARSRSFTEYIQNRFDSEMLTAIQDFIAENPEKGTATGMLPG